jgi:hypothetical protein
VDTLCASSEALCFSRSSCNFFNSASFAAAVAEAWYFARSSFNFFICAIFAWESPGGWDGAPCCAAVGDARGCAPGIVAADKGAPRWAIREKLLVCAGAWSDVCAGAGAEVCAVMGGAMCGASHEFEERGDESGVRVPAQMGRAKGHEVPLGVLACSPLFLGVDGNDQGVAPDPLFFCAVSTVPGVCAPSSVRAQTGRVFSLAGEGLGNRCWRPCVVGLGVGAPSPHLQFGGTACANLKKLKLPPSPLARSACRHDFRSGFSPKGLLSAPCRGGVRFFVQSSQRVNTLLISLADILCFC